MTENEKALRRYQKRIRRLLLVKTPASKQFLSDLEGQISDFTGASGESGLDSIVSRFGTPEEVASSFFASTDIAAIRKKLTVRRAVVCALLAALVIWGAAVGALYIEAKNDYAGSYETEEIVADAEGAL
jgi:hypothetical protein